MAKQKFERTKPHVNVGTIALIVVALPIGFISSIRPRRLFRLPMTSPRNSSGVTTSTAIIGSSSFGFARFMASLKAIDPAILKARSLESTSWYDPSISSTFTSTTG